MKTLKRHPVLWLLTLGVLIAAAALWTRSARGVPVQLVHPKRSALKQTVVTTGRVRLQRPRIAALVTGRVTKVLAEEGATVEAAAPMLELDTRESEARLAEAQAVLAKVTAQRRSVGRLQLPQTQEMLQQAQAREADAREDLRRLLPLSESGAIAKKSLEQARTTLAVNESARRSAELQLDALGKRGVQVQLADAEVEQAKAAVALARAHLDYNRVHAPVAGTVTARHVEVGDVVTAGATVFELAASGHTELVAQLDERNLAWLSLGQPALVSAEAYPSQRFSARVNFIAPAVDPARGTVEVRLQVDKPPAYLRPDMTVSLDIEVAHEDSALTLPLQAVRDLSRKPYVLLVEGGRAVRRAVQVGIRDALRVELRSGVGEADAVIATGGIEAGQRVRGAAAVP